MSRVWLRLTRGPRRNSRSSEISPCSRRYDCERCGSRVNPFCTRLYQVACQRSCYAKTPRRGDDCRSFRHTVVQTIQPTPTKRAHTGGGARVCCSCTKGISGERSPSVLRWRCHIRTPRCALWDERVARTEALERRFVEQRGPVHCHPTISWSPEDIDKRQRVDFDAHGTCRAVGELGNIRPPTAGSSAIREMRCVWRRSSGG